MKRTGVMMVAAVVGAVASPSSLARADDARPVVFWASVVDPVHPATPVSFRAVPGAFPAASAAGWLCTASPPHIYTSSGTAGDPARGVAGTGPSLGESADLTCTAGKASVSVTALCMLSPADSSDDGHFTLADAQGHGVEVAIHCANDLPAASLAELRALRPGDSIAVPLALHTVRRPAHEDACAPPYSYDAGGTKHFKPECFARTSQYDDAGTLGCEPPFAFDSAGLKHFKPECL